MQTAMKPGEKKEFIGFTGTSVFSGYFAEEYLTNWDRNNDKFETFDKMMRSDGQIAMVLRAIKGPLKSAKFNHVPYENDDKSKRIAEFLDFVWFENPYFDWTQWLTEILTSLEMGFSIHERRFTTHHHRDFGLVHILAEMGYRKQATIERFEIRGREGLVGVSQVATGDTVDPNSSGSVFIPVKDLVIFSNDRVGDNWEGISILRPCYGAWFRKNLYLKLMAIGIEKAAIGTPLGTYPRGAESTADKEEFIASLKNFALHESSFIVKPEKYDVEIIKIAFDADKIMAAINYEDLQMAKAILFQFLELGGNSNSGSFALSSTLGNFALSSLQFMGDMIARKMHKQNIDLVRWNFGDQATVPPCRCTGIHNEATKDLADIIKILSDGRIIRPDDKLEEQIRELYNLPAAMTTRDEDKKNQPHEVDRPTNRPQITHQKDDEEKAGSVRFSEGNQKRPLSAYEKKLNFTELNNDFDQGRQIIDQVMRSELQYLIERTIRGVTALLKKNEGQPSKAAAAFALPVKQYEKALLRVFLDTAEIGMKSAGRDLEVKLSEWKFNADVLQFLPSHVKEALRTQADFQAGVHGVAIEKIVATGLLTGAEYDMKTAAIISSISEMLGDFLDSSAVTNAASIASSQNIGRGRFAFFFNPENVKQIQAFQYSAVLDDRTTDICLSLDGQIMTPHDPDLARLRPPNHYNCRSILVPITINEEKPEITGIQIDPNNPNLIGAYKDKGKPPPDMRKIRKSRNL